MSKGARQARPPVVRALRVGLGLDMSVHPLKFFQDRLGVLVIKSDVDVLDAARDLVLQEDDRLVRVIHQEIQLNLRVVPLNVIGERVFKIISGIHLVKVRGRHGFELDRVSLRLVLDRSVDLPGQFKFGPLKRPLTFLDVNSCVHEVTDERFFLMVSLPENQLKTNIMLELFLRVQPAINQMPLAGMTCGGRPVFVLRVYLNVIPDVLLKLLNAVGNHKSPVRARLINVNDRDLAFLGP